MNVWPRPFHPKRPSVRGSQGGPGPRSLHWGVGFAALVGLGLCSVPLFGTLGPESALVLGVLLPPWAAAIGARSARSAPCRSMPSSRLLCRAVGHGWLLVAVPVLLLALNALRFKTCEPFSGLSFLALGPLSGVTLASVVGVALGSATGRTVLATSLAAGVPLVAIGKALWDFVATPGIFAFGHFFGYFPGTLYDRRVDIPDAWFAQRALDVLIGAALWALVVALRDRQTGTVRVVHGLRHPIILALAATCTLAAGATERKALHLGQRTSSAYIKSRLGLAINSGRCQIVVPRELEVDEVRRLAQDCDFRVRQLETALGVHEDQRITAYFFRSANEKRTLMGAANVYIAKPWRREVYLQLATSPHPVLAHELAHVVARHAARGPFGIAGHLYGLIPEPTLVEGLAVALEPTARGELTSHQWAKAAQQAGVAPTLETLLGPSFFGRNQALAYTLAGSFLQHVLETRGKRTVREIYRQGDVVAVLGRPWSALEAEWRRALSRVPLPEHAQALAQARFERPGVFSQVCPHTVERLEAELSGALASGDIQRAVSTCRTVLDIDPNDTGTRALLVDTLARTGDSRGAQAELARLVGPPSAPGPVVARARVGLSDGAFIRGDYAAAEAGYRTLLREALPEAELRQIEVKLLGVSAGDPLRRWVAELLIGPPGRGIDTRTAVHATAQIAALEPGGLGPYLAARLLSAAGRYDLARPLLGEAVTRGLATRRLLIEAYRQRALAAFNERAYAEAEGSVTALAGLPDATLAEQLEARDWRARIDFVRRIEGIAPSAKNATSP